MNNPLRYTDPTGHRNCEEDGYNCPGDKTPYRATYSDPDYSDWYSGKYGRCFMCHAATANRNTILTNSQLATSYNNATRAQGYEAIVISASIAVGVGVGLSLPAATTSAGACASNAECSDIADNAFVKFDPTKYDSSIDEMGLLTEFSKDGRTWLTQFKYAKDIVNSQNLETILYRKDLWTDMAGRFADGATLRLVNISGATPAGVTNMTNGIPQWYVTFDISSDVLQVIWRLP